MRSGNMALTTKCILLFSLLTGGLMSDSKSDKEVRHDVSVQDVVFVIRNQEHPFHLKRARLLKADIEQQCRVLGLEKPKIVLLTEKYGESGHWVIFPLLPKLGEHYGKPKYKWIFFCEEETRVKIPGLLNVLRRYDPSEFWFLGKELRDQAPSIIHHYRFHNDPSVFAFPDFEAGWLLSVPLLQVLSDRWKTGDHHMDFTIDLKHEIAFFIWDDGKGVKLTHVQELCSGNIGSNDPPSNDDDVAKAKMEKESKDAEMRRRRNKGKEKAECVTTYPIDMMECGPAVSKKNLYFAVKTCEKFHKDRVPVVKNTWAQYVKHIQYFSETEDKTIPTVVTGIPNTERGHCGKTFFIFDHFLNDAWLKHIPWLIITDDDTILSVSRLQRVLSCYDPETPVYLGERYGFGHTKHGWGYDYITGGGGMVFSRSAVQEMISNGCQCRSNADPDDMIIGACVKRIGQVITHSPLFHQARPADYVPAFLQHQTPVSFHKHSNGDPYQVYKDWFQVDDEKGDLVLDLQDDDNDDDGESNDLAQSKTEDKGSEEAEETVVTVRTDKHTEL
ncbi:beta-1,3-glucosyltransferase-like [Ptychodera flava]|uniref:beta-1,3-glucosyltransferase-like n=1 Tax=Ptychodera flava TaxID=63121 RepID=UPI00396A987F